MLTCISRSKQPSEESSSSSSVDHPPPTKHAIRNFSLQIKDMAVKASHCTPCANRSCGGDMKSNSEKFKWKTKSSILNLSSTPPSVSGRRVNPVVFVEESEPKEWVAQVEAGVLITFVSLPRGANDLKRIRFSREKFNKLQAQEWWEENCEKVMELYNVQRLNREPCPRLPSTVPIVRSQEYDNSTSSKMEHSGDQDSPAATPPLGRGGLPRILLRPAGTGNVMGCECSSNGVASTPSLSSSHSNADRSVGVSSSVSNGNRDLESLEWTEQDGPGVYITIMALPDGRRELRRVRFREKFGDMNARLWWEENRARIHKQYHLSS